MANIEMLTTKQIAAELGLSAKTVRRKHAEGKLHTVQIGGKGSSIRMTRKELEKLKGAK